MMYSMAKLNPDKLPDLGHDSQFTPQIKQGEVWMEWGQGHGARWGKGVCCQEDLKAGIQKFRRQTDQNSEHQLL